MRDTILEIENSKVRSVIMVTVVSLVLAGCVSEEKNEQPTEKTEQFISKTEQPVAKKEQPTNITEQPTDQSIHFRLYPSDFFEPEYQENYSISGTIEGVNTVPINVTGSFSYKPNGFVSFNSAQTQSVYSTMTIKETPTNALTTVSGDKYYSTDIDKMRYFGSLANGVYTTTKDNSVIPKTATIGETGTVGEYVNSINPNVEIIEWKLQDGYNGKANFVLTFSEYKYKYGDTNLVSSSVESYLITPEGNRLSMSYESTDHQNDIITKVSGERAGDLMELKLI